VQGGEATPTNLTGQHGVVDDDNPNPLHAAAVLRALASRVRAGDLDGKKALPFLLGAAAALEAQADATGTGSASGDLPAST